MSAVTRKTLPSAHNFSIDEESTAGFRLPQTAQQNDPPAVSVLWHIITDALIWVVDLVVVLDVKT